MGLEMLVGSGLAGKSKSLIEQCSSPEVAIRPSMRKVHSEVLGWRDELVGCLSNRPDGQSNSGRESLSTLVAGEARNNTGQTDGGLAETSVRSTPAATVSEA